MYYGFNFYLLEIISEGEASQCMAHHTIQYVSYKLL